MANIFTSARIAIPFAGVGHRYVRADLEMQGLYHGEVSYEGRIFFNNPEAGETTAAVEDAGYAGSFHVFGHGGCYGDAGHCEISGHKRRAYDLRSPHALTPAFKRVTVTSALRRAAASGGELVITIVPVVREKDDKLDREHVFRCEALRLLTYN